MSVIQIDQPAPVGERYTAAMWEPVMGDVVPVYAGEDDRRRKIGEAMLTGAEVLESGRLARLTLEYDDGQDQVGLGQMLTDGVVHRVEFGLPHVQVRALPAYPARGLADPGLRHRMEMGDPVDLTGEQEADLQRRADLIREADIVYGFPPAR